MKDRDMKRENYFKTKELATESTFNMRKMIDDENNREQGNFKVNIDKSPFFMTLFQPQTRLINLF